jgi:hypothetical protein
MFAILLKALSNANGSRIILELSFIKVFVTLNLILFVNFTYLLTTTNSYK